MANYYLNACSISLAIRKIQIKTTLRLHLIPVRIAFINNPDDIYWKGYEDMEIGEILVPIHEGAN